MRRIYINEKQFKKCIQTLQEIDVNGDAYLAASGNANTAAQQAMKDAEKDGVPSNVPKNIVFSGDAVDRYAN